MMTLRSLRRHPAVLKALTGLSVTVFDALLTEALPALAAAEQHRLSRPHRQRAIGGGHPYALAPAEQVLAAVIWLRLYPTDRVLGWLFGIEETSVRRLRSRVVPVLVGLGNATLVLPDPGRRLDQAGLLAAVPELAVIVDTYEQPVQRPKGRTSPDRWYSGKKKQHTGKVQVLVVETTGQFVAVSETKPGPTNDLALLRESGCPRRWPSWGIWPMWASPSCIKGARPPGANPAPNRGPRRMCRTTEPLLGAGWWSSTACSGCGALPV